MAHPAVVWQRSGSLAQIGWRERRWSTQASRLAYGLKEPSVGCATEERLLQLRVDSMERALEANQHHTAAHEVGVIARGPSNNSPAANARSVKVLQPVWLNSMPLTWP